ncbi:hypothetical protein C1646_769111 [Rhizophagus diaphanus]|nr:hypothetical protein C1646_769111 [Rhizophagus diaphanus] [Rhizophagus sp. MUCL 43196]
MTFIEYLISTCLGYKKYLYCEEALSIRKRMCSCDKTIKLNKNNQTKTQTLLKQLRFHTESNKDNSENNKSNNNIIDLNGSDNKISEKSDTEQMISFNLIIKSATGLILPSKWLEIEVSSLNDILAEVHYYIRKLTGDEKIIHSDYLVSFKLEKSTGIGAQLADMQDYKKFLDITDSDEETKNKNIKLRSTDNTQPSDFPIFSQAGNVKENPKTSTSMMISNSNSNTMLFFFTISPQIIPFTQNSIINDIPNLQSNVLPLSKQPIPSLDEFFTKLDKLSIEKFTRFKNNFISEQITVDQIYNLIDVEFD